MAALQQQNDQHPLASYSDTAMAGGIPNAIGETLFIQDEIGHDTTKRQFARWKNILHDLR